MHVDVAKTVHVCMNDDSFKQFFQIGWGAVLRALLFQSVLVYGGGRYYYAQVFT
jgi:hypothetical protein